MLKYFFILLSFLIFVFPAEARVYLDINAPTFVQIPIVLAKWKSIEKTSPSFTEKVYEMMANDLTLMLTVGCGGTPSQQFPLGRGRNAAGDDRALPRPQYLPHQARGYGSHSRGGRRGGPAIDSDS